MRSVLKRFSPFMWPTYVVKTVTIAFFAIMLPIYVFIGLQPATATDFSNYPHLIIDGVGLDTPVEALALTEDHQLSAPARIAGSFSNAENKTLLIGHSSTVFHNLHNINYNDKITFDGSTYKITDIKIVPKSEISMARILAPADQPTIIIMTCAGQPLGNDDFSDRLIISASQI